MFKPNIRTSLSGSLSWKPTHTNKFSWVKKRFQTDFQLLCTYCIHVYLVPKESIFHWLNAYYIIVFVQSKSMKQICKIDFDPSNGGQEPRSRGACQSKGSATLQSTEHLTNNRDPSIDRTVPTGNISILETTLFKCFRYIVKTFCFLLILYL